MEVSALLDTHTLLWVTGNRSLLSKRAEQVLDSADRVYISAASAWEIATKVRLGRLPAGVALEQDFANVISRHKFELLSIDANAALLAGRLPDRHKDPFDRMLAAQAISLDIPLISIDTMMDSFGVRRIW